MRVKNLAFILWLSITTAVPALAADHAATASASAEVAPLVAEMAAAANSHDTDRHVAFYAHDPAVILIFNGEQITGWEAIRDKQREWWKNGKTDVVYTMKGEPAFRVLTRELVLTTSFMHSRRTLPSGELSEGDFAVSALWQKRPEGWRVIYSHESTVHR